MIENVVLIQEVLIPNVVPIIVAFLTGIAGPSILTYLKYKLNQKKTLTRKKQDDFRNTLKIQEIVNSSLVNLQIKYDLDRVWISQFHNGGNFYPGNKSMKKMSTMFEATAPGVSSDLMKNQNIPVSFFSSFLQKLNTTDTGITVDVSLEEDFALRSFWDARGIRSVYMFPVKCTDGNFIGIMGVDFVKRDGVLSEDIFYSIMNEANRLTGFLATLTTDEHAAH